MKKIQVAVALILAACVILLVNSAMTVKAGDDIAPECAEEARLTRVMANASYDSIEKVGERLRAQGVLHQPNDMSVTVGEYATLSNLHVGFVQANGHLYNCILELIKDLKSAGQFAQLEK